MADINYRYSMIISSYHYLQACRIGTDTKRAETEDGPQLETFENVISRSVSLPPMSFRGARATRNPKIPHCTRDMDFSLRKISHPAHAGIRNDRKEGRNDKKRRVQGVEDSEKKRVQGAK